MTRFKGDSVITRDFHNLRYALRRNEFLFRLLCNLTIVYLHFVQYFVIGPSVINMNFCLTYFCSNEWL